MSSTEGSQENRSERGERAASVDGQRGNAEGTRGPWSGAGILVDSPITRGDFSDGGHRHEAARRETVCELTARLHAAANLEQGLQRFACAVCQMVGGEEVVGAWTDDLQVPAHNCVVSAVPQGDLAPNVSVPSRRSVYDAIAERVDGVVRLSRAEVEMHPVWQKWSEQAGSDALPLAGLLAVALRDGQGRPAGFLRVSASTLEEFSAADEDVFAQLATHAAIALQNLSVTEQLRRADQRKNEFLATLAHEIRNPLTSIRTGLDLLASGERGDQLLEPMENQFEQLQRVVDDLMDVPRLVRGKIQLRRQQVSVGEVVRRAIDAARTQIDQHGHTLSVEVPDAPLMLDADPVRIAQSIGNLLTNAAKYTDRGGRIWLRVRREGERVAVSVRDNGVGIEPELASSVFDLFQQADRSLDHAEGGLGIGLTLVKNLAEMHGGEIAMHSEGKNRGSEFTLRLPLDAASRGACRGDRSEKDSARPLPSGGPPSAGCSSGLRILVVDDNRSATTMLARLIGKLGDHVVSVAHEGAAAVSLAQQEKPHLVVLDIGLPEMSGHEVARQMRRLPELQQTMLVALTGYGDAGDRRESLESGFDLHLVKPIGIDDLRQLFEHPKLT